MKRYKGILATVLTLGMMMVFGGCGTETTEGKNADTETENQSQTAADGEEAEKAEAEGEEAADTDLLSGKHHAEITIKEYGTLKVELDADTAPITVTNFVKLANDGFYDGLTFHRIISGFMIQGGDPLGNGMGGSDENIKGEFAQNGVENNIAHKRGVLSMARAQSNDSASSQFFIMHQDAPHLDGAYAAFGMVTEGIEIVDQICEDTQVENNNRMVKPENQPVIESIKVVD